MDTSTKGRLFLIPNVLGDTAPLEVVPMSVKKTIEGLRYFVFEKEKAGRAFVKRISTTVPQNTIGVFLLNKFTTLEELHHMLTPLQQGNDVGLITDAGCPGVADPGADLVALAHKNNIRVTPLVGPSSILLAVMASGLNGQSFAFNGYLPIDKVERKKAIKQSEKKSKELQQTQVFIETPYRNNALLEDLCKSLHPETKLSVACDITLPTESIKTKAAVDWKNSKEDFLRRPAVFSFLAS
ncbi:MAG: SAM-dependent methyltransferase [Bacteroidetes bacterium]|nr:SAM-dependent methyltransferase [Bacteroidota bacterium]MDA0888418.1 SAM-dependent methyltransferase [Bacteroidota bacterium]MDA1084478.1 SAM-dependent methyltransferase [Bacteroidota bacterium]